MERNRLAEIDRFDPALLRPPRRPCAAAIVRPQPAGQAYLKVPFARCGDGVARHVSTIASLREGPFRCLDCEEVLTLRQPVNKRRHFAHRPDLQCAGETALHRYAKELLALRKTLTLPALVLHEEGVFEEVFATGSYTFDEVHPEHRLDSFQPDALVKINGHELAVEFLVHHAVDGEKRRKVRGRDLSMVEIDLSGLKARQMEGAELDEAILHNAPRSWIHHRKAASAKARLDIAVAAKRAERGGRLKGHILRARRGKPPADWTDEALPAIRRTGLEHLIGVDADCGHWFTVPDRVWQAEALYAHVVKPSETFSPGGKNLEVKGDYPDYRDLSSRLPAWMIRTDLSNYPLKRLTEAGFSRETYGSAHSAVWSYLATLTTMGEAVYWDRDEQAFFIDPELQFPLHRRCELHSMVTRLLRSAEVEDVEAAYRAWAHSYRIEGANPAQLEEVGGDGYRVLISRLTALQSMASGYFPKVVDDLCDLPLEEIRQRNADAIAAEAARKAAAEAKAAEERRGWIRSYAREMLAEEATAWLAQRVKDTETSFLDYAGESDETSRRVYQQLERDAAARRHRIANERDVAKLRETLEAAATAAFPSSEMAKLFLKSSHPRLGGAHPFDYCRTQADLVLIKTLLPRRR